MKEKRKSRRIEIEIDVTVDRIDKKNISREKIKNISPGGICLITDYDLPLSASINLIFYLADFNKVIIATGEIVWNEYLIDKDYFYCGVKFIKIAGKFKEMITQYVNDGFFDIRKKEVPFF
jgi:c-di-GMP-binding flagellar brake protein YcgR